MSKLVKSEIRLHRKVYKYKSNRLLNCNSYISKYNYIKHLLNKVYKGFKFDFTKEIISNEIYETVILYKNQNGKINSKAKLKTLDKIVNILLVSGLNVILDKSSYAGRYAKNSYSIFFD